MSRGSRSAIWNRSCSCWRNGTRLSSTTKGARRTRLGALCIRRTTRRSPLRPEVLAEAADQVLKRSQRGIKIALAPFARRAKTMLLGHLAELGRDFPAQHRHARAHPAFDQHRAKKRAA